MIEGYNTDGTKVLINPHKVESVFGDNLESAYGAWCNVQMEGGTIHRFRGSNAQKVYVALQSANLG